MTKGVFFNFLSFITSLLLLISLMSLWMTANDYQGSNNHIKLTDSASVNIFLEKPWLSSSSLTDKNQTELIYMINTGVHLQSFEFTNPNTIKVGGYIWQHYVDGLHDAIKPKNGELGFYLPEQVNTGSDIEPSEVYRMKQADGEVIGWYFEATLRQAFSYDYYPFDHKTVWIRILPKQFMSNIILIPDFSSYKSTGVDDVFGMDKNIILGEWRGKETYFDYKLSNYSTNFGIDDFAYQNHHPELYYNFVINRQFETILLVNLSPIFIVLILLYGGFVVVNNGDAAKNKHGFNTTNVVGTCLSILAIFVVMHTQLRSNFAGHGIVYLEYFYFLVYVLLVLVVANALLVTKKWTQFLHRNNNLVLRTIYWPVVLFYLVIITSLVFA